MREHDTLSVAVCRAMIHPMQQPTMFCHDGATIYYPTGPGRVHMIAILALYDCDGSDSDFEDSTAVGDAGDLPGPTRQWSFGVTPAEEHVPMGWPDVHVEANGIITETVDIKATTNDFAECVEMWADWCDRDAARLDRLDGPVPDEDAAGILARLRALVVKTPYTPGTLAQLVEAISASAPAVAV